MRRLLVPLSLATALALAGGASASESSGAGAPKQAASVVDGGGGAYAPAAPRKPVKRKPAKRKRAKHKAGKHAPTVPGPVKAPPARPPARRPPGTRHHFPIAGPFDFGGAGGRFGAGRNGHAHQGQDLAAAAGTPVVAPVAGVIQAVQYQGSGAGHYVVLDGDGVDRDYVFMHLQTGSIPVPEGTRVRGGQLIGRVGHTGRSFGSHLHFEIWVGGGWYSGGRPTDPLPLLRSWASR